MARFILILHAIVAYLGLFCFLFCKKDFFYAFICFLAGTTYIYIADSYIKKRKENIKLKEDIKIQSSEIEELKKSNTTTKEEREIFFVENIELHKQIKNQLSTISNLENSKYAIEAENIVLQNLRTEKHRLNEEIEELKKKTEQKAITDYEKAKQRVLNNYNKKQLEKQALLELIEDGIIFKDEADDKDLKYLKMLQKKYNINI